MNVEPASPRPGRLKAVGYLNLLVGTFLLLLGGGCLGVTGPFLAENSPFRLDPVQTRDVVAEMRRQLIEDARKAEQSAPDAASKARSRAAREELEATNGDLDGRLDFEKVNESLPWLSRYLWADLVSAPVVNLLMAVSGAALLLRRTWGRRLAAWAAWLKIARLVALSLLLGFVVVPHLKRTLGEFAATDVGRGFLRQAIQTRNAGGLATADLNPDEFVQMIATLGYAYALGMLGLGAAYPAVALILLARGRNPAHQEPPPGPEAAPTPV